MAGSAPITVRNAVATWTPRNLAPPGCRRSTLGRILPNLSTGFDPAFGDGPDHRIGEELGRKRAGLDRRDDDLAFAADLPQEGGPPFGVELGQNIVQQEYGALARAPGHQSRLSQLQAHHRRALLPLRAVG